MSARKQAVAATTTSSKRHPNVGVTSGLSVREYWAQLFVKNAKAKLTDGELARAIRTEFPRPGRAVPKDHTEAGIPKVRSWYNNGGCTEGKRPKVQALQYNSDGEVVGGPRGTKRTAA